MKKYIISAAALLLLVSILSSCGFDIEDLLYRDKHIYKGVEITASETETVTAPDESEAPVSYTSVKVVSDTLDIYSENSLMSEIVKTLTFGTVINVIVNNGSMWPVYNNDQLIGYCQLEKVALADAKYYAELPVEYGTMKTAEDEEVTAYSHLVDVTEYNDKLEKPMVIDMILRTYVDADGVPFYTKNICMLQYDTLIKLLKAQEIFVSYGYTIKIYDAYRPTSVQYRWYKMVGVHKWVANPDYKDGGIHDRGIAVDMSLVDLATGEEIQMATAMHTFSDASARAYEGMTEEQKQMLDFITKIMTQCGFTYINSEWWHYQDSNKNDYLKTDHPIDSIPLVIAG